MSRRYQNSVAQRVDATYEHMRQLVGGRAYRSIHLLRALATTLGGDCEAELQMVEADKFHRKYKALPKLLGISPELEPFEAIIPHLSKQSRDMLLAVAKTL